MAEATVKRADVVLHKRTLCRGCKICELVCSASHDGVCSSYYARIHVEADDLAFLFPAVICTQCQAATCHQACPLPDQALCVDPQTGARYIHESACNGCGECAAACPLPASPIWQRKPRPQAQGTATFFKCDLCRDIQGGPQCVQMCPWGALEYRKAKTE